MKKGQVAIEFFTYATVFLIVVIVAASALSYIQSAEIASREFALAKDMGESFANAANLAIKGGRGFNYTISYERTILGRSYDVCFLKGDKGSFVFITWAGTSGNVTYSYPISAVNYKSGDRCIQYDQSGCQDGYKINSSKSTLTFYNDGENITLSQGC